MYCPNCGAEDNRSNQYCRSCGGDLRRVRTIMAVPDAMNVSAAGTRDEIGRAVADRIRQTSSADELAQITEDILPEIEKFLESPAEKRLRRIRNGMIVSSVGLGVSIGFTLAAIFADRDLLFFAALGVVAFFIGFGFILNGYFLSQPKISGQLPNGKPHPAESFAEETSELKIPASGRPLFGSVTEGTTRHLKNDDTIDER